MDNKGLNDTLSPRATVGVIVGIAVVATLLIILTLVALMVFRWWRVKKVKRKAHIDTSEQRFRKAHTEMRHEEIELTGGAITTTDGGPPQANSKRQTYTEEDIRLQKRRTRLGSRQFPRGDLLLLDYLGDGEYGPIYRGEAYNLGIKEKSRPVTVKMLVTQAPEATRIRFEQDIALLSSFNHLNVVGMLAVCTEDSPECILLDAGKDMLSVIRDRKINMEQQTREGVPVKSLAQETVELLKIADEVCIGLAYLASQRFVHKDLALRNCIIGYDGVTKVANFGLGPAFYPEAYHRVLQGRELPIRWMAPEAISSGQFTITNDIWAFGVLMWEIFTYGELPYSDKSNENVINFVAKDFGKLTRPENCVEDVYLVMSSCWELEPQSRPTFITLHENIFDVQGEIELQIQ